MSETSNQPQPSNRAVGDARRMVVAPLWKAGASIREIAKQTNIPRAAVGRAVMQLEKVRAASALPATTKPAAQAPTSTPSAPPSEPVGRYIIDGITYELRELKYLVREPAVKEVVKRGLVKSDDPPWRIVSALYANLFEEGTIYYLRRRGWQGEVSRAEAIIAAVNDLVSRLPR